MDTRLLIFFHTVFYDFRIRQSRLSCLCVCMCTSPRISLLIINKWSVIEHGQSDEWLFELTVLWEANAIIVLQVSIQVSSDLFHLSDDKKTSNFNFSIRFIQHLRIYILLNNNHMENLVWPLPLLTNHNEVTTVQKFLHLKNIQMHLFAQNTVKL